MNTEDSEFQRLEHEALLRASQPAQPVQQGQKTEAQKVAFAEGMSCRPASVQRQPLTMAEIKNMDCRVEFDEHLRVVRMTEAVHGIGA